MGKFMAMVHQVRFLHCVAAGLVAQAAYMTATPVGMTLGVELW